MPMVLPISPAIWQSYVTVNEMQARYLISPYFKYIYVYLAQKKLPNSKAAIEKVKTLAERYILIDSLLFNW